MGIQDREYMKKDEQGNYIDQSPIEHSPECQCSICKPQTVKPKKSMTLLKNKRPQEQPIEPIEQQEDESIESNIMPPRKVKNITELNDKVEQYYSELRSEIDSLKPKHRLPQKVSYLKWIFFAVLVFILCYGLYLFWMLEHGKRIVLPFMK